MIYRFRGVEPGMMEKICSSLEQKYQVEQKTIRQSYRTAQPILDWLNPIFQNIYPGGQCEEHVSAYPKLWGRVTVLPKVKISDSATKNNFVNPLANPQIKQTIDKDEAEAEALAHYLLDLYEKKLLLDRDDGESSPMQWGDVMILARQHKPLSAVATAFARYGIPTYSPKKETLHSPYVWRTLVAFLQTLVNPYDDLSLLKRIVLTAVWSKQ